MRRKFPVGARRGSARLAAEFFLVASLSAGALQAQSLDLRHALARFQLELSALEDTTALRQWEHRFGGEGGTPETEAIRRLRRGWIRLRLGQLGDPWSPGRAIGDFSGATKQEPDWPETWYALGRARRQEADRLAADRANLGKRVGFGTLEAALAAFREALRLEPGHIGALRELYDGAVALRDTGRMASMVLPVLRAAGASGIPDPSVYFALGRAERLMGAASASVTAFRRYLTLGGDPGPGLRELAWSAFLAGDGVADSAYAAGALLDDSATVAGYREDLGLIATEIELARFDAAAGPERVAMLQRFWQDRDRQALRDSGERIREHYRRITYAERYFGLEVNRRYYGMDPTSLRGTDIYHSGSTRFDDRGVVHVRHGAPADRVLSVTWGIQPNETWRYARADGDLLLHFAANVGGDVHDLRLIGSVTDIGGVDGADGNPATLFALLDRCRIHEPYCKYLNWGSFGRGRILREERAIVLASTRVAVSSDGDERHFAAALSATSRGFAVGQAGARSLVHIAFQVGLAPLPDPAEASAAFTVPLQVRVNLTDSEGRSGGWIDTSTTVLVPGGGGTQRQVEAVGRVALPVPPGQWRYQVALAYHDTIGVVLPSESLTVRSYDGARLTLSDLVLSRDRRGARWIPALGDTAYFNPRTVWSTGDVLSLYHEIYGLREGSRYEAKLVLRRGRTAVLALGWNGEGRDVTRVTRTLSLEAVAAGAYVLELEVTAEDGASARSATPVKLTAPPR